MSQIFKTLLVAINGSEASIDALKYALAMKKQFDSKVIACYVVDTATIRQLALSRIFVPDESEEYERSLENSGKRYLNFCLEIATKKRLSLELVLGKGSVAGEIIKAAAENGANCIVIGGILQRCSRGTLSPTRTGKFCGTPVVLCFLSSRERARNCTESSDRIVTIPFHCYSSREEIMRIAIVAVSEKKSERLRKLARAISREFSVSGHLSELLRRWTLGYAHMTFW